MLGDEQCGGREEGGVSEKSSISDRVLRVIEYYVKHVIVETLRAVDDDNPPLASHSDGAAASCIFPDWVTIVSHF